MYVSEIHTVSNNTDSLYIPSTEKMEFQILGFKIYEDDTSVMLSEAIKSVSLKENDIELEYDIDTLESYINVSLPYGKDLLPGQTRTFIFSYTHPALVYQNGVLIDAYIHAFAKDFKFDTPTTKTSYTTKLVIPNSLGKELNFISPTPDSQENNGIAEVYSFNQETLVDQFVWLQLGRHQIYDFSISQTINPTENKLTGLRNRFELILPRDFIGGEVKQSVFFKNINPEPKAVYEDEEGNLIGEFEFYSNGEHKVTIEGYAVVEKTEKVNYEQIVGSKEDIPEEIRTKYTQNADFWEVDAAIIRQKANEEKGPDSNVYSISSNLYSYVVDTIDYSQIKRFGINERQGALKTLQGGAAVCMEYSDLYLTLMRSSGIPTRAAFGYGYDPRVPSEEQEAHQWVQVYMPGLENNWVDVDVTWGESGELLVGGDLNHFYTHVAYKDPNTPAMVSRYSFNNGGELFAPVFNISTVDILSDEYSSLDTPQLLLQKYEKEEVSKFVTIKDYIYYRSVAGAQSLQHGIDLENSSQLMVIGFVIVFAVVVFGAVSKVLKK